MKKPLPKTQKLIDKWEKDIKKLTLDKLRKEKDEKR